MSELIKVLSKDFCLLINFLSKSYLLIGVLSGCFVTIFLLLIGFLQRGTQIYNKDFTIHYIEKMNDILKKELSESNQKKMEYNYSLNIAKQKLIEKDLFLDELTKANDAMNTATQLRKEMLRKYTERITSLQTLLQTESKNIISLNKEIWKLNQYRSKDRLKIKALNEQIRYHKLKSTRFERELKDIPYYRECTQIAESFISTNGLKKAFDAYLELKSNVNKRRVK